MPEQDKSAEEMKQELRERVERYNEDFDENLHLIELDEDQVEMIEEIAEEFDVDEELIVSKVISMGIRSSFVEKRMKMKSFLDGNYSPD